MLFHSAILSCCFPLVEGTTGYSQSPTQHRGQVSSTSSVPDGAEGVNNGMKKDYGDVEPSDTCLIEFDRDGGVIAHSISLHTMLPEFCPSQDPWRILQMKT